MERKLQIGVMGSAADLNYSESAKKVAERIGELIAEKGGVLFFGAEKDYYSLPMAANDGAKRKGGLTVGITYGKDKEIYQNNADVIIPCGLERGGGREFVLVLGCDAIIAISGGSGTLTELAIAYQANIPMIALKGYGGWTDKMAGKYFDERKRRKILTAYSAREAVELAIIEAKKNTKKKN